MQHLLSLQLRRVPPLVTILPEFYSMIFLEQLKITSLSVEIIMLNTKAGAVELITLVVLFNTAFRMKKILIFSRLLDLLIGLPL